MTRRDILKGLAAFAACVRAYAKTPQGPGRILVRMRDRQSDICLMRGGAEITRQIIPIGRAHFVNDVAWCLSVEHEDAAELVRRYGIPAREARRGTLTLAAGRRRSTGDTKGSTRRVSRKLYAETIEARAVEFAGFIGKCIEAAGPGEAFHGPLILAEEGARIVGLAEVVERVAEWEVRYATRSSSESRVV
jgi:cell division ATPase FtsA